MLISGALALGLFIAVWAGLVVSGGRAIKHSDYDGFPD